MFWQRLFESVRGLAGEAEREVSRRDSLENGLRQTLHAIADSEFLGADEAAAMLARLTVAMSASAARRVPRLGMSWIGAAAAFMFILTPLFSPWMNSRVALYASPATPVVRLASAGASSLSRQATPAPATALSAQPTVWPAMDLALARTYETAYPKATLPARQRN